MKSLLRDDYEIDVLFGKVASILIIAFGFLEIWRHIAENRILLLITFFVLLILIPLLYLFSLNTYNVKAARFVSQSWQVCIILSCISLTPRVLNHFQIFWKLILPAGLITICMMIGVKGLVRIKEPDNLNLPKDLKIPETYCNLILLLDSVTYLIALSTWFVLMVLIGKYFHDFAICNWPSFEKQKVIVFYVGIAIGCYPAKILGAVISAVFTVLINRIYEYYASPSS